MSGQKTPKGWYPDPENEARERYWDGKIWTTGTRDLNEAEAGTPDIPANAPWYRSKKVLWGAGAGFALLIVVAAIAGEPPQEGTEASDEPTSEASPSPDRDEATATEPVDEPEPEPQGRTAAEVEQAFIDGLFDEDIRSMCDALYTHWACFYQGIEQITDTTYRLILTTDGGWSDNDLAEMSEDTARHWFNFMHYTDDHADIDTFVVQVNGRDRNHYKRQFPYLN